MATNSEMVDTAHQKNAGTPAQNNDHGNGGAPPHPKECLSCRIMGTGVLAGTGSYAIWQSRASAPGSPGQKKIVAGLGLGMSISTSFGQLQLLKRSPALLVGSVFRWRQWK